jgi:hypothetical protein
MNVAISKKFNYFNTAHFMKKKIDEKLVLSVVLPFFFNSVYRPTHSILVTLSVNGKLYL